MRLRHASLDHAVTQRPDSICEVISPGNANDDTVRKLRLYHRIRLPHYWLVDLRDAALTVLRWSEEGYVTVARRSRRERWRRTVRRDRDRRRYLLRRRCA